MKVTWGFFDANTVADYRTIAEFLGRLGEGRLVAMYSGPDMGQVTVWYREEAA